MKALIDEDEIYAGGFSLTEKRKLVVAYFAFPPILRALGLPSGLASGRPPSLVRRLFAGVTMARAWTRGAAERSQRTLHHGLALVCLALVTAFLHRAQVSQPRP